MARAETIQIQRVPVRPLRGELLDRRGRPLARQLPADPEMRRDLIQQWLWDMGA